MAKTITIEVEVRPAKNNDLLVAPLLLRLGQPYYIKDPKTNKLSGVYVLDKYTNSLKLEVLYLAKLIYVPVVPFIGPVYYDLQQTDLKIAQLHGHNTFKDNREHPQIQN